MLRVSLLRASLNSRTSASASTGEKPNIAMLDPPSPPAENLKNCLRVTCMFAPPWFVPSPVHPFPSPPPGACPMLRRPALIRLFAILSLFH